jgi:biopolymer transport protein ExbD
MKDNSKIKFFSQDFDETDWANEEEESYGIFLAIVPYADMMTLLLVFFIFFFMLRDVELGWKVLAKKNTEEIQKKDD